MPKPDEFESRIVAYLSELERQLERLRVTDRNDLLREIDTHLRERLERLENADPARIEAVFEHFGSAAEIAAQFQEERAIRRISVVRSPLPLTRDAWIWATVSLRGALALLIALLGYLGSLTLLATAAGKVFFPDKFGVWIHAGVWGLSVGTPRHWADPGTEVLGYWYIPTGLLAGVVLAVITTTCVKRFASLCSRGAAVTEARA